MIIIVTIVLIEEILERNRNRKGVCLFWPASKTKPNEKREERREKRRTRESNVREVVFAVLLSYCLDSCWGGLWVRHSTVRFYTVTLQLGCDY